MLGKRVVQMGISQAKPSSFNVLAHFKSLTGMVDDLNYNQLRGPRRFFRETFRRNQGQYEGSHKNLTYETFDDSAAYWHAYYSQHPFYLHVFQSLENLPTVQFGTVDNPVVVFTADAPFRYVGCTGLQNEDDYEQHQLMIFMLKEGPLQRCPCCGQVFKLVRLLQEDTAEMDFYKTSFNPIEMRDSARVASMPILNLLKINTHYEPNDTEDILNVPYIYDPMDIDLHQRLLTDPAYRMWRFHNLTVKRRIFDNALLEATREFESSKPQYKLPIPRRTYENLIEAEMAWDILDRLRGKVYRFHARKQLDFENHERREKRMQDRAAQRWESNYTYYFGGLTEEEQRYRDYYQTDQELDPEEEMFEQHRQLFNSQTQQGLEHSRFDFQEYYTTQPEDDQASILEKKLFRFKYRYATDSTAQIREREARMIKRQAERLTNDPSRKEVIAQLVQVHNGDLSTSLEKAVSNKKYLDLAAEEAWLTYKDYYQDDKEADLPLMESLYRANPTAFLPIYQNYCTRLFETSGYETIPKRQWDESQNLFNNYKLDLLDYINTIVPKANKLSNQQRFWEILPVDEQILLDAGIKEAKAEAKAQIEEKLKESTPSFKPVGNPKRKK